MGLARPPGERSSVSQEGGSIVIYSVRKHRKGLDLGQGEGNALVWSRLILRPCEISPWKRRYLSGLNELRSQFSGVKMKFEMVAAT